MTDQDPPTAVPPIPTAPVDLRRDGRAALDWTADYLHRIRELPVMAQVAPGEIAAALPARMPERAEPFAAVLADLDRVLLPGVTHWQHPRFFSYFPTTASEPAILAELLAELLAATLNQVAFIWRASPAATELEAVTTDWLAALLGLRTDDAAEHLSDYGPALGRRFRSLKLWAVLRCYGRDGLRAHLRRGVALARGFADRVAADPDWELVSVSLSLVCFRCDDTDQANLALLDAVNAGGDIFITHTRLAGRVVLRLAVGPAHHRG